MAIVLFRAGGRSQGLTCLKCLVALGKCSANTRVKNEAEEGEEYKHLKRRLRKEHGTVGRRFLRSA
jgi:hypothetical protein